MPSQFLNILLQKSDPKLSWGFDIVGGREYGLPLTICQVSSNSFSSQYLSPGDEIVSIEGVDASIFTESEASNFIKQPSKSLDLVILKRPPKESQNKNETKSARYQKQAAEKYVTNLQTASPEKITRRKVNPEKKKGYRRSSSVPSKYSSCGPPTYQLNYTVPDVDTNQSRRFNSIRDRSESPPFWRSNQNNVVKNENSNMRNPRVFWRQLETSGTDGECDNEVARYCKNRSRRDRWVTRSNSIDSSISIENTWMANTRSQATCKETSQQEYRYRIPVQLEIQKNPAREDNQSVFDSECDKEVIQYSRSRRDRWNSSSTLVDSSVSVENTSIGTQTEYSGDIQQDNRRIPVHFNYYEHRDRAQKQRRVYFSDQQQSRQGDQANVSKIYLSPYDLKMHKNIIQSLQPLRNGRRRQTSQSGEKSPEAQTSCENSPALVPNTSNCNNAAAPPPPPAPAPPPPPPPAMNGTIPTIRLKSEIPDRCEPPAKILNAMSKDKKPFTYTPGGLDLSEIKSPRMQRRIIQNAQTPDDIILPTPAPPPVNHGPLPPSAVAAMTPQIAIPVFPQNGLPKKSAPHNPPPPPQMQSPQKQTMTPPPPPQRRSVSPTPQQQPASTVVVTSQQNQTPQQQQTRTIVVNSQPSQMSQQQQHYQNQAMTPPPPPQRRSVSPTPLQQPAPTVVISQQNQTPQQQPTRTIVMNSQPNPMSPQQKQLQQQQQHHQHQQQQQHNPQPSRTIIITNSQPDKPKDQPRAQVGSIYVPPVVNEQTQNSKPSFPVLREAPTPWLQKNQPAQEDKTPAWVNRNRNNAENEQKEVIYERKPRVQQVRTEKEFSEPDQPVSGTRVIPIQIEGATQTSNQSNSKPNSQRWGTPVINQTVLPNPNNVTVNRGNVANSNKSFNEPDTKPIQSRSFKVIQRITGSEDDNVDYSSEVPYNTENVPLSQLRRLHLCNDDQAFMNKVKSQANGVSIIEIKNDDFDVDEDVFLHSETDPRYRGSAIPSKAFRKLQNMTDSGQVIPITIEVQSQEKGRPSPTQAKDTIEEPQKKYIPPSERQAEQDLRKYMGSSIPSRSFRMLQAMTSTQQNSQNTKRIDNIDEDARFLYPNPWPNPPKCVDEIGPFWIDYMYLFNLVLEHSPDKLYRSLGEELDSGNLPPMSHSENFSVSNFHHVECSENENLAKGGNLLEELNKDKLIIDEVIKDESDHEVSLTICIPLRKKSKSVEYHEEVTLKDDGKVTEKDPPTSTDSVTELNIETCPESAENSPSADTKDATSNSSDTEHSESSSVDFWKEIATDEDIYFKPRSITSEADSRPRSSTFEEETTTDDDGFFKPTAGSERFSESRICDKGSSHEDGYTRFNPKLLDLDQKVGSQNCDESNPNKDEVIKSDYLESITSVTCDKMNSEDDGYFNLRPKTPAYEIQLESPWYQNITDDDGYPQSRPKSPAFERRSESPDWYQSMTDKNRYPQSRPKTPAFEGRLESPAWYQNKTDEDEYPQSRPKPLELDKYSGSDFICDQLTTNQDNDESLHRSAHHEAPRDSWDLGQDIKDYCKYTPMDSETNSSSTGSAEDLEEPFENTSNSSSSEENDSYNVYEFSTNAPQQSSQVVENLAPDDPVIQQDEANNQDNDDSGMSEAGKDIVETEPQPLESELRKLSKYQRANTHSRLLRILQEEEDKLSGKSELTVRKESLTLPLAANPWLTESVSSSSGINSPLSPVLNEKLVNELVQSLLNNKGLGYHKLPTEKLREAAVKSLYESCSDTSRACSPYYCPTDKSKHASQDGDISQTDCYGSHDDNSVYYPGFDIFPSRAFKNLQSGRSTPMNWPKCPLLQPQSSPNPQIPNKLNSTPDATHDR